MLGRKAFTLIELLVVIAINRDPGCHSVPGFQPGSRKGTSRLLSLQRSEYRNGFQHVCPRL
jgi:hypothetical protein